jgi:transcriptional regulator with XRE-family HTH domain
MPDVNARIAARVRELRERDGLSLDALAGKSAVSRSMISLIERGETSATAVVLEKIATGLGVTLGALFDDGADASQGRLHRRPSAPAGRTRNRAMSGATSRPPTSPRPSASSR